MKGDASRHDCCQQVEETQQRKSSAERRSFVVLPLRCNSSWHPSNRTPVRCRPSGRSMSWRFLKPSAQNCQHACTHRPTLR